MTVEDTEVVADLFEASEGAERRHRDAMRRQGLVGWVLYHATTGIVLHLYQKFTSARAAIPSTSARHGVSFRVLGVNAQGLAFEQVDGRALRHAVDLQGRDIRIPLHGRRIDRRSLRCFVPATSPSTTRPASTCTRVGER